MAQDRVDNRNREPIRQGQTILTRSDPIIRPRQPGNTFLKFLDQSSERLDPLRPESAPASGTGDSTHMTNRPVEAPRPLPGRDPEGQRHQEGRERVRERDPERESVRSGAARDGEGSQAQAKVAERKVIARSSLSQRQDQGSRGKGDGRSGSSPGQGGQGQGKGAKELVRLMDFRPVANKMKGKEGPQSPFEAKLAQSLRLSLTAGARAADPTKPKSEVPQTLPKPVVDQIVQYVQLVVRKDGEKEIDITLHEKVFRGLRLRAAVVRGKVEATFTTSSSEVRDLFNSQKVALRQALAEKGFDVREIHVIMMT